MPNTQPYDTQKAYIARALLDGRPLSYDFWVAHRVFCHHKRLAGIQEEIFRSVVKDPVLYASFSEGEHEANRKCAPYHQAFFPIINVGSCVGNPIDGNRCGIYRLAPGWRGVLKKVAKEKGWLYA
jgi:hypothetical protein